MKSLRISLVAVLCFVALCSATFEWDCASDILVRTLDGSCNNLIPGRTNWGVADSFLTVGAEGTERYEWQEVPIVRPLPTYANKNTLPSDGPRGNSRRVSNSLYARPVENVEDTIPHNLFAVFFGQFINHDFEDNRFINNSQSVFPMGTYLLDQNDPTCAAVVFPPPAAPFRCNDNNTVLTSIARLSGGAFLADGSFKVYNNASSYLDLNTIYGAYEEVGTILRSHLGGKLLTEDNTITLTPTGGVATTYTLHDSLPTFATLQYNNFGPTLLQQPAYTVHVSGDGRVDENGALTTMHLIWVREHNNNAKEVLARYPLLDPVAHDEFIFQRARAITIAKYQKIIFEEYIPSEFGQHFADTLGPYFGYKINTNAGTALSFASAAFRYGHTSLNEYAPLNPCGQKASYNLTTLTSDIPFLGMTAAPAPLSLSPTGVIAVAGGFEGLLRGIINRKSAPVGGGAANNVRNLRLPSGVVDLITLDLARARYNRVPNYQKLRSVYYDIHTQKRHKIYGAPGCSSSLEFSSSNDTLACFEYITGTADPNAIKLQNLYGKVNRIDPIVGLLSEEKVPGSSFGRTIGNIIIDQYKRARDGDRFFYKQLLLTGYFSPTEAYDIINTSMKKVLQRSFPGTLTVPENPFLYDENYVSNLAASAQCAAV